MAAKSSPQEYARHLRRVVPLESINEKSFDRLLEEFSILELPAQTQVFELGDTDDQTIYLLDGELRLTAADGKQATLVGGDGSSLYALSNLKPRRFSARSVTSVVIALVNADLLEQVLNWDQIAALPDEATYVVDEIDDDEDASWMFDMMRTNHFFSIPPANVYKLFSRLERCEVKSGDVVLREGEPGDFYYLIRSGSCVVSRRRGEKSADRDIYRLQAGDAFGEEALVSDRPRNADVTMSSDGVLMRLDIDGFRELLQAPLLKWVTRDEALAKIRAGAELLDIRLETEFHNGSIKGARSFPLYDLRSNIGQLDEDREYIVVCNTGARSASAAYLMEERGFSTSVLRGGLASLLAVAQD